MRVLSFVRPRLAFAAAFAIALALSTASASLAYHTAFVRTYCNYNSPTYTSYFTRDGSATVAYRATKEGYQWGGGCWNDNNVDDSYGDPTEDPNTGGEGPDCSGLVFKVWREATNTGDWRGWEWNMFRFIHGPYTAYDFKVGAGAPNAQYPKAYAIRMDAFANSMHIGLIWAQNPDGTDQIAEAKGEYYGTNIWTRGYRGASAYYGVRRVGWSA
jgi:hypothetical protein